MNRALGARIVDQFLAAFQPRDGSGIHYCRAFGHHFERRTRDTKVFSNIRVKCLLELSVRNVDNRFLMMLIRGVVHEYVQRTKLLHGVFHNRLAKPGVSEVAFKQQALSRPNSSPGRG